MNVARFDVAIVGAGFAGSILARVLAASGKRVALIERDRLPRFALGESSTPLAALALERLARRFGLDDLHQLAAYGRWQRRLPGLRCGLKRGFTFYRHERGHPFANDAANRSRLLVAASPTPDIADTHWLRSDVDHYLARAAEAVGVRYWDRTIIDAARFSVAGVNLFGRRQGQSFEIEAKVAVDASGPAGVLATSAGILDRSETMRVRSGLLYAHLDGLATLRDVARDTSFEAGPFDDEEAAVHHLLEEGWMYELRFDHGTSSVGILLDGARPHIRDGRGGRIELAASPAAAASALLARYPSLEAQHAATTVVEPWRFVPRVQYRRARAASPGLFLLPHTFAFTDPLFSTGMAWSLLAVERLADILTGRYGDADRYATLLAYEADIIETLIAAGYSARHDFARFAATSALYFAAVSFDEVRQRLQPAGRHERPDAWYGFLGCDQPERRRLLREVMTRLDRLETGDVETAAFAEWLFERLAPFDIIGITDKNNGNLHPVDLDVLVQRAALLGLDRRQILAALPRLRGNRASGHPL